MVDTGSDINGALLDFGGVLLNQPLRHIWPRLVCCALLIASLPQLQCSNMFEWTNECFDTHIKSNKANIEKNAATFCREKGFRRSIGYTYTGGYIVDVCCDN